MSEILSSATKCWQRARRLAQKAREDFDKTGDLIWGYYKNDKELTFRNCLPANKPQEPVTVNKVYEFVELFLPYLYHRNPTRQVSSKSPTPPQDVAEAMAMLMGQGTDPVSQAISKLKAYMLAFYLGWSANELNLKYEAHLALIEGLTRGRGILWQELRELPWGKVAGSFYVPTKDLLIDPDAEMIRDAGFVMRRKRRSVDQVMREFGIPRERIKPTFRSNAADAGYDASEAKDEDSKVCDIVEYWEVYSRIGCGGRLAECNPAIRDILEEFGDHCYLVIADGNEYPLNLPPELAADSNGREEIARRLQWPTEFYNDPVNPWPFAIFDPRPGGLWPEAPLKPSLEYQKFLDWAYSFLMSHIRVAGRQIHLVDSSLETDLREQLKNGVHHTVMAVKLHGSQKVQDIIQTITFDTLNKDLWQIIQGVNEEWKKSSGVSDLMYAQVAHQMRSAQESSDRHQMATIRPEFLANGVDEWMSAAAKNEILVAAKHLSPSDIAPVFGEQYAPQVPDFGAPFGMPGMPMPGMPMGMPSDMMPLGMPPGLPPGMNLPGMNEPLLP